MSLWSALKFPLPPSEERAFVRDVFLYFLSFNNNNAAIPTEPAVNIKELNVIINMGHPAMSVMSVTSPAASRPATLCPGIYMADCRSRQGVPRQGRGTLLVGCLKIWFFGLYVFLI